MCNHHICLFDLSTPPRNLASLEGEHVNILLFHLSSSSSSVVGLNQLLLFSVSVSGQWTLANQPAPICVDSTYVEHSWQFYFRPTQSVALYSFLVGGQLTKLKTSFINTFMAFISNVIQPRKVLQPPSSSPSSSPRSRHVGHSFISRVELLVSQPAAASSSSPAHVEHSFILKPECRNQRQPAVLHRLISAFLSLNPASSSSSSSSSSS